MQNNNILAKIALLSASFILLVGFMVFGLEKIGIINLYNSTTSLSNGPTPQQKAQEEQTNANAKQQFLDNTYQDKNINPSPTNTTSPTVSISAKQEDTRVIILQKIQSVSEGSCKLTATNGNNSTTQEAKIIYQPEFSSCAGFSVPINGLGSGVWSIELTVTTTNGSVITKSTKLDVR